MATATRAFTQHRAAAGVNTRAPRRTTTSVAVRASSSSNATNGAAANKSPSLASLAAAAALATGLALASPTPSALAASRVSFGAPATGATVSSPVHVEMAVSGMAIKPASEGLQKGSGHFHLFVDADNVDEGEMIPFDDAHKHYGKGQTAADVELAPGRHRLTLQFANALHESYGAAYSKVIVVDVQ